MNAQIDRLLGGIINKKADNRLSAVCILYIMCFELLSVFHNCGSISLCCQEEG